MLCPKAKITGERFSANDGAVVIEENTPAFLRMRNFEMHSQKQERAVNLMIHRFRDRTRKHYYVSGESDELNEWTSFAFNEVGRNHCVLSIDGPMSAYRLTDWAEAITAGQTEWGFELREPQVHGGAHRSVYRGFVADSLLLIGRQARPDWAIRCLETDGKKQCLTLTILGQDGKSAERTLKKGEEHPLDKETLLRVGFVYERSGRVELDVETTHWDYWPDEWLSRLLYEKDFTISHPDS